MDTRLDTRLIRQFWSVVQSLPTAGLASWDDASLSQSIVDRLRGDPAFDPQHLPMIDAYIRQRLPLIREMTRQVSPFC